MRRALALAMLIAIPVTPAGATTPRQKVHQAIARGPNAVQALVHQAYVAHRARALGADALDRALMDGARTNTTVARALIAPGYSGAVESNAPPLGPVIPDTPMVAYRPRSGGCWGYLASSTTYVTFFGSAIARVTKTQNGWCGNGSRITTDFGWGHSIWAWGPYCVASVTNQHGWDRYPSWEHGGIWGSPGVRNPWGCAGVAHSIRAVIRIAGNGHHDHFNDYGY